MLSTVSTDFQQFGESRSIRRDHQPCECCQLRVSAQLHVRTKSDHHSHGMVPTWTLIFREIIEMDLSAKWHQYSTRTKRGRGSNQDYSVDGYNMRNHILHEFYWCFGTNVLIIFRMWNRKNLLLFCLPFVIAVDDLYKAAFSHKAYLNTVCLNVKIIWEHDFDRRFKEG